MKNKLEEKTIIIFCSDCGKHSSTDLNNAYGLSGTLVVDCPSCKEPVPLNQTRSVKKEFTYEGVEGFCTSLGTTVQECIGCGCLVTGESTRCKRCAIEGDP